jgi:hypothetical protein
MEAEMHAARRAYAATELAAVHRGFDPEPELARDLARLGARFHLALYEAGIDLTRVDDAATVAAVLFALGALPHGSARDEQAVSKAFVAAVSVTTAEFAEGIRRAGEDGP